MASMPDLPLRQLALYAAVAAVILVVGWRATASGGDTAAPVRPAADVSALAPAAPAAVVVDVAGAVRRPGVYRLPGGARVLDAVRRARPRPQADLAALNLAARLADGEQVVVPRRGQAAAPAAAGATPAPGGTTAIVHLNSATLEQLEALDGIGPALAQRIVDYRTAHGGFRALEELDQVSGFGPARMAALRGHVAL
jgi:competence protein ComEA